jgi:hypothetical protein
MQMSDYTVTNTTSLTLEKFNTEPVMAIHLDGRVTVSDKLKPDEAAGKAVEAFKTQWMADVQATKIRELQSDVNAANERIKRLEAFLAEVSRRWECKCHYAIQKECDCCRAEGLLKEAKP